MKKLTFLFILFVFLIVNIKAQNTPKLAIGIFNNTSIRLPNTYWGMGVFAGPQLTMRTGSISLHAVYQFSTNSGSDGSFPLQSHLVGGGFQYRILNREKRFSPFIEITVLSEVGTNYRGKYMSIDGYFPTYDAYFEKAYPYSFSKYHTRIYHSTPFVGRFIAGFDIRLTKGLHLNLGAGYGLRGMKTKTASWQYNEELSEQKRMAKPENTEWFHMIDVKLGLTYVFSFNKKE